MKDKKSSRRLILFPGQGADRRLVQFQFGIRAELEVATWIDPEGGESLASYAKRIAATLDISEPVYLGGISFGGMVALEVARHVPTKAVFLVASARSPEAVQGSFRGMNAAEWMPSWALSAFPGLSQTMQFWLGVSPTVASWAPSAVAAWKPRLDSSVPVFHIHGNCDAVIPCEGVVPDRVVAHAGHLLNVTHWHDVNRFITESIDSMESRPASQWHRGQNSPAALAEV